MALKEIIAEIDRLKKELDRLTPMKEEYKSSLMDKVYIEWTYHSCKLEQNELSYGETRELLKHGQGANKPYQDQREIKGHQEAILYIEDTIQDGGELTKKFIRELNHKILKEPYSIQALTPDGEHTTKTIYPGKYKTTPNHVKTKAGDKFEYAKPVEVPSMMEELLDWFPKSTKHPLLKSGELHYRFILIHPFDDGNGRVSRLLMNYSLMKEGFPPIVINSNQRDLYFSCLRKADVGEFESLYEFLGNNLIESLELYISAAKGEDINEYSDLDKRLKVFDKKLSQDGKEEIRVKRSDELIKKRFEDSIWPFFEFLIENTKKFYSYFADQELQYMINQTHFSGDFQLPDIKNKFLEGIREEDHIRNLGVEIRLHAFKKVPENPMSEYLQTNIKFQDYLYIINPAHKGNEKLPEIKKRYDQSVTDEEITDYVKKDGIATLDNLESYYESYNQ